VFEVCDARERYPMQCAKQLEMCIKLTNDICVSILSEITNYFILYIFILIFNIVGIFSLQMTKVIPNPVKNLNMSSFANEHSILDQKYFSETDEPLTMQEHKLQVMINKIENLTAVLDQIKRDKVCGINKLLWS